MIESLEFCDFVIKVPLIKFYLQIINVFLNFSCVIIVNAIIHITMQIATYVSNYVAA